MGFKTVFSRYEYKYLITKEQKQRLLQIMEPYMKQDQYGKSTIRNLYFDTNDYLLIRRSIEKPIYKEKLRVRSYTQANSTSTVFVELKKKFNSVVYKRRLALPEEQAMHWLTTNQPPEKNSQISKEIHHSLQFYQSLHPVVFLSYEREAFFGKEDSDFRITFDENVLFRTENLSLQQEVYGQSILPENVCIMEIKCSGGIPLWLVQSLSKEKLYKTSFSKYGTVYVDYIFPKLQQKEITNHDISTTIQGTV